MAVIIPQEMVKNRHIREGDEVAINIINKGDLSGVFGTLKTKLTGQQLKDQARKDWESASDRKFRREHT